MPLAPLTEMQQKVFSDRYALKDQDGKPIEQHLVEMWERVSEAIAAAEPNETLQAEWQQHFYDILADFRFVPGGRILAGAGTGTDVTFYNCYVIPSPADSRGGIMDNLKLLVDIMARGGGVGVNLSSLRPRGSYIKTVNGTSSGPVSWANLYSTATRDVIQQGGSRRGALMLMLNDDHPDVLEFIRVKEDLERINGANLSVCVSDDFMATVKAGKDWNLLWEGKVHSTIPARELWNAICESAWRCGEPGMVFMERCNKEANTWYCEDLISVNPCGEQPLPAWGVCNLGAINLAAFVSDKGLFDFDGLHEVVPVAVRFLDNVVDANNYFLPENERQQKQVRRTGLGTMGLADALIKARLPYGSEESLRLVEGIYRTIRDTAYSASVELAREKGAFPLFDATQYVDGAFIRRLPGHIRANINEHGIRNAVLLTQAPTGTTSLLAGVSSGIEPVYDFVFKRTDRIGEHIMRHPLLEQYLAEQVVATSELPAWFVSANDLTPLQHVEMQALIQRFTDASISKTVNAPHSHTVADVQELYQEAYELGCKGITYFRDGCREGVLAHIEDTNEPASELRDMPDNAPDAATLTAGPNPILFDRLAEPRPTCVAGRTYRQPTPLGTAFVTVTHADDGEPYEIFANVGKAGSDTAADAEAFGRLLSLILRLPSPYTAIERLRFIVEQLDGIGGGQVTGLGPARVRSLPDGISKVLKTYLEEHHAADMTHYDREQPRPRTADLCPECGHATLVHEEGCAKCLNCAYSVC